MYLGNFSTDEVFYKLLNLIENPLNPKRANRIDKLKKIVSDRIEAFEKDPNIRRKYMATAYESDITDLVRPHLDKARVEGIEKGKIEGKIEGKLEGKLESARLMKNKGYPISDILEITGLSELVLKENGIS
jgi:predicted transposase/invertase (TIGR01784 family)